MTRVTKLKLLPRSTLQAKVKTGFAGSVAAGTGISVSHAANVYTVSFVPDISLFSPLTSADLAAVMSDETGSASGGLLVFNNTPSFQNSISIISTDAGATAAPNLSVWRNSASPAASDLIGYYSYFGNNSLGTGVFKEYARTQGAILDPTAGSEDGQLSLQTMVAGTLADRVTLYEGVQVGSPTGGDKGAGTLNAAGAIYSNNVLALLTSDIGVSVQAFDADLSAVAGLTATGLIARTGSGTAAARTITGTANEITLANGDGVSNNPTVSLPAALTFTGKTVTGGTFSGPTLSGTVAGSVTFSGTLTFSAGTATIQSTDAGATAGPNLSLYRNSATPAASDLIGYLSYFGQNTSTFFEYARAGATILDPNAASEDSEWYVSTAVAGTLAARATIGQGLRIGSPTGGDKGSGTINAAGTIYVNESPLARAADNLSFFAATTSAQLAGVISDETGSGALMFAASPTTTGTLTGEAGSWTWATTAGSGTNAGSVIRGTRNTTSGTTDVFQSLRVEATDAGSTTPTAINAFRMEMTLNNPSNTSLFNLAITGNITVSDDATRATGFRYDSNIAVGKTLGTLIGYHAPAPFGSGTVTTKRAMLVDSGAGQIETNDTNGITSVGPIAAMDATAIPAGGTAGSGFLFSSTSNFGIFFGSGAPTLSAAKGSLYLRSDGSSTSTRAYINTDGGTTWTAVTTAA